MEINEEQHPVFSLQAGRTSGGFPLTPGYNVDKINVEAGINALKQLGYTEPHTAMVIEYALMRWALGEEKQAERGAIDKSFHGIDFTSWRVVLAHAMTPRRTLDVARRRDRMRR